MTLAGFSDRAVRLYGWILDQVELDDRPVLTRPWPAPEVHWDSLWKQDTYLGPSLNAANIVRVHLRRTIAAVGTGVVTTLWYSDGKRSRAHLEPVPLWDTGILLVRFKLPKDLRWISLDAVGIRSEVRA